jgi:hypothetical protein
MARARVARHVRQRLLHDAKDGFLRAGRQAPLVGQRIVVQFGGHLGAEAQRLELIADGFDQPHGCQRLRAQLGQQRLHLRHRRLRQVAHMPDVLRCGFRVVVTQTLRGCSSDIDAEQLLLDGVVQVARQAVALLLDGGFAQLGDQHRLLLTEIARARLDFMPQLRDDHPSKGHCQQPAVPRPARR